MTTPLATLYARVHDHSYRFKVFTMTTMVERQPGGANIAIARAEIDAYDDSVGEWIWEEVEAMVAYYETIEAMG